MKMKPFTKLLLIFSVVALSIFLFAKSVDEENVGKQSRIESEHEDHDMESDEDKIFIIDGYKAIQLDEDTVNASGLTYEKPKEFSFSPEFIAYAEIVDIAPLVSFKSDYLNLSAKQKVLKNDLYNHNKILQRAKALHDAKSLSTREFEKIRADRDLKISELNAIDTALNNKVYKLKSSWGEKLAEVVLGIETENMFDLFAAGQKQLLLVSLPKNKTLNKQQQNVYVNHLNQRKSAERAVYFDFAKQVTNPAYGQSYYYLLNSQAIRVGMRLFAWVSESDKPLTGYFINESAVVWYANEPWVYVKHKEDIFIRKPLSTARKINDGWLIEDKALIGNDLVVSKGGQTLLSEEFKWAIPDEDND